MSTRTLSEVLQEPTPSPAAMARGGGATEASPSCSNSGSATGEAPVADFNLIGPCHLSTPSWNESNYRRIAMSCFVEAAYLLELDRAERRQGGDCLAPDWYKHFSYSLSSKLVDPRDSSIYGALLEHSPSPASDIAMADPGGAPRAVLALRGTILRPATFRRDFEEDVRFFFREDLKGTVRFRGALETLRKAIDSYGAGKVCVVGHSLGAGLALQVGKTLAKEGAFVECHLFNPPSLSLHESLRRFRKKASSVFRRLNCLCKCLPPRVSDTDEVPVLETMAKSLETVPESPDASTTSPSEAAFVNEVKKFVPTLYINNCDYICCYYADRRAALARVKSTKNTTRRHEVSRTVAATLFTITHGPRKFMEAHGLQQWWSDDAELRLAEHDSKVIYRHLKSLYSRRHPETRA